ncbi:MAG: hypothetical protein ACTSU5_08175 [Promethearchaeota archaeon]
MNSRELAYAQNPEEARLGFLGALVAGVAMPVFSATGLVHVWIGSDFLLLTVGAFLTSAAFVLEPKLAFVLPFRAAHLAVIDDHTGIPVFTYTWGRGASGFDGDLFSGMMHGVSMIVGESVKRGELEEIVMTRAVLIVQHSDDYPASCVLVASNSSKVLRNTLRDFTRHFFAEYGPHLKTPNNLTPFRGAVRLVREYFPFVPEYEVIP